MICRGRLAGDRLKRGSVAEDLVAAYDTGVLPGNLHYTWEERNPKLEKALGDRDCGMRMCFQGRVRGAHSPRLL